MSGTKDAFDNYMDMILSKRASWYKIMSNVMPSFKEISNDAYDLLELW